MGKIRLGVNIDHVATVRNARGENYPSPARAALLAQKMEQTQLQFTLEKIDVTLEKKILKKLNQN